MYLAIPSALNLPFDFGYQQKQAFHTAGRAYLKRIATEIGLQPADYKITSNKGGDGVGGDVVLHGETIYLMVTASMGEPQLMFRSCKGRKDYCGGRNHFASFREWACEGRQRQLLDTMRELAQTLALSD